MSGFCADSTCDISGQYISAKGRETCTVCGSTLRKVVEPGETPLAFLRPQWNTVNLPTCPQADEDALLWLSEVLNDLNRAILHARRLDFSVDDFSGLFENVVSATELTGKACEAIDLLRWGEGLNAPGLSEIGNAGEYAGQAIQALKRADILSQDNEANTREAIAALQSLQIARDKVDHIFRVCIQNNPPVIASVVTINNGENIERGEQ